MPPLPAAQFWIRKLGLRPHPEGGFFREMYRAPESIRKNALPPRYAGRRSYSTSIYFLLISGRASRFHRLRSDEIWHFYEGSPLTLHLLAAGGRHSRIRLGRNASAGQVFQAVLPAGTWFGATVDRRGSYSLVGCTVAPGFSFADFEPGRRAELLARFPRHARLIKALT